MCITTSYHIVLNNPLSEVNKSEHRMFVSQRHVIELVCYSLIHMENSKLKALTSHKGKRYGCSQYAP